ncbi:MAG: S1/P1 nuclease [Verrucomicrobiota bacterium]
MHWKTFLSAAFSALLATAAQAWDDSGHLLIAEIAAHRLRPEVIRKMEALTPLLDTRFDGGRPYNVITAAVWLDDMRGLGQGNPWKLWHYIDVPCAGDAFTEPPPPHALSGLDQAVAVLRSPEAAPEARAEALAQVMHIVGDIHQPLHTATRDDRGGNGVRIAPLTASGSGPSNLHAFWDAACRYDAPGGQIVEFWKGPGREARPQGPGEPGVVSQTARALLAQAPKPAPVPASPQPWWEWARETHAIACKAGWPPSGTPQKNGVVQLTPAFVHESHAIAMQQVLKAGERLADLLNELFSDGAAK